MLLSILTAARAAPCAEIWPTDEWAHQVHALVEPVALAEAGVSERLDSLAEAAECTTAPIERGDLARLWLARGAMLGLSGVATADARRALGAAKALGAEAVWDPNYGPVVRALLEEAPIPGEGTLRMTLPHDVLVVDGEVIYETGAIPVPAGSHLVQWSVDGVWQGEWIEVSAGCDTRFGAGAPARAAPALPPIPSLGEMDLTLTVGAGYANAWSEVYVTPAGVAALRDRGHSDAGDADQGAALIYRSGGATGSASAELGWRMAWLSLTTKFAPAPPLPGRWPATSGTTALLGARGEGSEWSLAGGLGLRLANAPRPLAPDEWSVITSEFALPEYDQALALGPAIGVQGRVGGDLGFVVDGELWGGPVASGWQLSFGPTARYGAMEPGLRVRAAGQVVARSKQPISLPSASNDAHTQVGVEATLGMRF